MQCKLTSVKLRTVDRAWLNVYDITHMAKLEFSNSDFLHTAQVRSTCLVLSNLSLLKDPVLLVLYHFTKCSLKNVLWICRRRGPGCINVYMQCTGSGETNYTTKTNESIKVHKETIVTVKPYKMSQHHTRQAFDYPKYSTYIYICTT